LPQLGETDIAVALKIIVFHIPEDSFCLNPSCDKLYISARARTHTHTHIYIYIYLSQVFS